MCRIIAFSWLCSCVHLLVISTLKFLFQIWTLLVAYLLLVFFYWTPETSKTVKYLGIPVWVTLMLHVSSLAGPLRLALLTVLIGLVVLGYMSEKGSPEIAGKGCHGNFKGDNCWRHLKMHFFMEVDVQVIGCRPTNLTYMYLNFLREDTEKSMWLLEFV